jgi:nitroreductase
MDIVDALRTTGAVRGFTDDPVGDDVVAAILDDARFAPSGGNQQPWRVAVVHDRAIRQQMAALMRPVWEEYAGAQWGVSLMEQRFVRERGAVQATGVGAPR